MAADIQNDIIQYIEMLSKNYGLSITIHPTDAILTSGFGSLFRYNFHKAPICLYCKQNRYFHKRCVYTQKLIAAKCQTWQAPYFFGVCHAGVGCYIFPIKEEKTFLGYICINGFSCDKTILSHRLSILRKHDSTISTEELLTLHKESIFQTPEESLLEALILPLPYMLRQLYLKTEKRLKENPQFSDNDLNMKIINYLYQNSTESISVEQIAKHMHFSRSYISHTFKKNNGISISEYLCNIRLSNAETLLTTTNLPISVIASEVGFNDYNYFSKLFHKQYGLSPKEYRLRIE